jgi:hypothetical protein
MSYLYLPYLFPVHSPHSCSACHLRDPNVRCPRSALNMSQEPIYRPGDMNQMFSGIVERFSGKYEVNVLSTDPWVVTFDNFVTDAEAKALISTVHGWERSTDTGSTNEFGETGRIVSQGRTSSNAWCQHDCQSVSGVEYRVACDRDRIEGSFHSLYEDDDDPICRRFDTTAKRLQIVVCPYLIYYNQ